MEQRDPADGTKQFLRGLLLLTKHPEADVCAAVARCVSLRAFHADAIESALRNAPLDLSSSRLDFSDRPELANVGNGIRLAADYDRIVAAQREAQFEEARAEEFTESPSRDRQEVVAASNLNENPSLTVAAPHHGPKSSANPLLLKESLKTLRLPTMLREYPAASTNPLHRLRCRDWR